MKRTKSILGYTAAALTIMASVLIPFVLIDLFTKGVAATGVHVDPSFSGGDVRAVLDRGGWKIAIHQPVVRRSPLGRIGPFVQVGFAPAKALPPRVLEDLDLDGDGKPDIRVSFATTGELRANIAALDTARYQSVSNIGRGEFDRMIARVGDGILVRVPLK